MLTIYKSVFAFTDKEWNDPNNIGSTISAKNAVGFSLVDYGEYYPNCLYTMEKLIKTAILSHVLAYWYETCNIDDEHKNIWLFTRVKTTRY